MYLTTPPVTDVVIDISPSVVDYRETGYIRVNVQAHDGITLGVLHDRVGEVLRQT